MRSIIMVLMLVFATSSPMFADEITVAELKVGRFSEALQKQLEEELTVRYDIEGQNVYLLYKSSIWPVAIKLTQKDRTELLTYIQKYKAWNKKASAEGDKFQKNIGELVVRGLWKSGDDWHGVDEASMTVVFFSQSTKTHQMVLSFEKWQSSSNEYISIQPNEVYIGYENVLALEEAISEAGLKTAVKKRVKEKSVESKYE